MNGRARTSSEAIAHLNQVVVDAAEERRIASYVSTSTLLRSLASTVDGAARRADALHRLDVALRCVPVR